VLWNHSSLAGLSELLRGLLDRDGDAVLPAWLAGGGDCKAGDHDVSPLQLEVPGDGVDQDCRGGDARALAARPKALVPVDCALPTERLDVLAIAVDALRADALDAGVMPSLYELARHAIVFERAYSPTVMTLTSVSAILSARPFADVGPKNALLDEQLVPDFTAPELFRKAGYRTAAFSPFFEHALFSRGFEAINRYWHDEHPRGVKGTLTSAAMSQGILELLGASSAPAFVWAHLSDTHARYSRDRDHEGNALSEVAAYYRGAAYVDQQLGTLFGALKQRGRLERTIIAVLADHGEELLARGRQGHGPNLFEESVHVPLVLWVPGCAARRVPAPVSLAHLMPTLGALARVDVPGVGLLPPGDLPTVVEAVTALNTSYKRAVLQGNYKLLVDVTNGGRLLFDLVNDPLELTDVLGDAPERAAELEGAYQRWLDAPGRR
jgi:arylsulfatase A-like enzyme